MVLRCKVLILFILFTLLGVSCSTAPIKRAPANADLKLKSCVGRLLFELRSSNSTRTLDEIEAKARLLKEEVMQSNDTKLASSFDELSALIYDLKNNKTKNISKGSVAFEQLFKKRELFKKDTQFYFNLYRPLGELKLKNVSPEQIEYYVNLKELADRANIIAGHKTGLDHELFKKYLRFEFSKAEYGELTIHNFYKKQLKEFKKASKLDVEGLGEFSRKIAFEKYNKLTDQSVEFLTRDQVFEKVVVATRYFKEIDTNINKNGFIKWLSKRDDIKSNLDSTLENTLMRLYGEYAPFSKKGIDKLPKEYTGRFYSVFFQRNRDRFQGQLQKLKDLSKKAFNKSSYCKNNIRCYMGQIKTVFKEGLNPKNIPKHFSCLRDRPMIAFASLSDLILFNAGMFLYYNQNKDKHDRFPWEITVNSLIFRWVVGEVNCAATFKTNFTFGKKLNKEFLTKGLKPLKSIVAQSRYISKKDIGRKGLYMAMNYLFLKYSMDAIFMSMGGVIENPMSLKETAAMLPFIYIYSRYWSAAKNIAIVNPLRHKIIPKMANMIQRGFKQRNSAWFYRTVIDGAVFLGVSKYNSMEFLDYYSQRIVPATLGYLGLSTYLKDDQKHINSPKSEKIYEDEHLVRYHVQSDTLKAIVEYKKVKFNGKVAYQFWGINIDMDSEKLRDFVEALTEELNAK